MCVLVTQPCPTLCESMDHQAPLSGKNTGVGCHYFSQRIFTTQGSKLGLPHSLPEMADSLPSEPPGKRICIHLYIYTQCSTCM